MLLSCDACPLCFFIFTIRKSKKTKENSPLRLILLLNLLVTSSITASCFYCLLWHVYVFALVGVGEIKCKLNYTSLFILLLYIFIMYICLIPSSFPATALLCSMQNLSLRETVQRQRTLLLKYHPEISGELRGRISKWFTEWIKKIMQVEMNSLN